MYTVRFIWVGKTQEAYLKTGIEAYLSKLKRYVVVELLEVKPANYSGGDASHWRVQETQAILKKVRSSETTIVLDERGKQSTSKQFAHRLEDLKSLQYERVNFVIGGAFGLDAALLKPSEMLSLSAMTFTHQMVRLVLLEQVYRAFTILNGESYHHE